MRQEWSRNWNDADELFQAGIVAGIGREEGQVLRNCGGRDHQIGDPSARLAACCHDSRGHPPIGTCRLGVEGDRVELILSALQDLRAPATFFMLVVRILRFIAADPMWPGGQLGEGNCAISGNSYRSGSGVGLSAGGICQPERGTVTRVLLSGGLLVWGGLIPESVNLAEAHGVAFY